MRPPCWPVDVCLRPENPPIVEANYFGWESNNQAIRSSKIFLGISNRFYMAIDGKNVLLDDLRDVIKLFSLELFPE